jgi:hypothetical protein
VLALAAVVLAAFVYHYLQARGRATPWIFPDEVKYADAARALSGDGRFGALDGQGPDGFLHVLLLSPAWLFHQAASALGTAKVLSTAAFALTAVPVTLIARRFAGRWAALAAAGCAVAVPAAFYASTLLQEPFAYPAAALVALLLIRAIESPTAWRLVALVGSVALGVLIRGELGILALGCAIALVIDSVARQPRDSRLAVRGLAIGVLALIATPVVLAVARGPDSLTDALGGLSLHPLRSLGVMAHSLMAMSAAVWVAPVVALVASFTLLRSPDRARAAFAASSLGILLALLAYTGAKAASQGFPPITSAEERNLIYAQPLALLSILVVAGRVRVVSALAASVLVGTLMLGLPLGEVAVSPILSENPGLSWVYQVAHDGAHPAGWVVPTLAALVLVGGVAAVVSRAATPVLIACALAMLWSGSLAYRGDHDFSREQATRWLQPAPDWLDGIAGERGVSVVVSSSDADLNRVWQLAIWNRQIRNYVSLGVPSLGLSGVPTSIGPSGTFGVRDTRLILHSPLELMAGRALPVPAPRSERLTDIEGNLSPTGTGQMLLLLSGRFPDGWVGHTFRLERFAYRPRGVAWVVVSTENGFITAPRTVVARPLGGRAMRFVVPPGTTRTLRIPVPLGTFAIDFTVTPSPSPADLGGADPRQLGVVVADFGVSEAPRL